MTTHVDAKPRITALSGYQPILWSDEDRIGIPDLDADHRDLTLLFNELFAAVAAGASGMISRRAADAVLALTEAHFAREEAFLEGAGYPELEAHRREHRVLAKELRAFLAQLAGDGTANGELLGVLREWAMRHILAHDRAYIGFLTRQRTQL